jgi:hypothetical protein
VSATQALKAARAAGVELRLDGDDLVLEASTPPPTVILELLSRHKPAIAVLLRPGRDGWTAEDWQVFLDERAGIAEFEGSLPRLEAETCAFACCVVEWLKRNFIHSPPGRCLACRGGDQARDPHGIEPTRRAGLHSRCWPAWHAGRKSEAVAALAAMGIKPPTNFPNDFGKKGGA